MFVKTFKKDYTMQLVILAIIPLLLWIIAFIFPPSLVKTNFSYPIYQLIYNGLSNLTLLSSIIAFILVFIQAILINSIFSSNQLTPKTSFFPAFIYILLLSSSYSSMTISPILIANCFILFAMYFLLKAFDHKEGLEEIFNANFFISLATLTFFPSILLTLWVGLALLNYRFYNWRHWAVSLLGLITPILFLVIYYFITDSLILQKEIFLKNISYIPNFFISLPPMEIIFYISIGILGLISLFTTLFNKSDNNISYRKKTNIMIIYFVISILPAIYLIEEEEIIFLFAPTLAFLLFNCFSEKRKLIYSNIIFTLFLIIIISRLVLSFKSCI